MTDSTNDPATTTPPSTPPTPSHSSRNKKAAAIAVVAVALVGVGTAVAASKIHTGSGRSAGLGFPGGGMRPGNGFGPPAGFDGRRGFRGGGSIAAAADYLGLTTPELFADLQAGKSLAAVAQATSGKSVDGLIAAMTTAERAELAAAVKAGELTQAQSDQTSSTLEARITALVNGSLGSFGRGPGFGGPGFGGRPGGDDGPAPGGPGGAGSPGKAAPGVTL